MAARRAHAITAVLAAVVWGGVLSLAPGALAAAMPAAPGAATAGTAALAPAMAVPAAEGDETGDVVWGVQPSSPGGPDGRRDLSYQVAPGTVISDWVAVTNSSAVEASFRVYAADAVTDYDTAAFTLIGADQASTGVGAWTRIDGAEASCADTNDAAEAACAAAVGVTVTVPAGGRADIPFTLTVPADATPGDHAAGIVASYVSGAAAGEGAAVTVEQRVGTRVYLRVDGPLSPGVGVAGTVAGYDGSWNPVGAGTGRAGFEVSNLGNTRVSVTPQVRMTGPFGIELGTVALDPVRNLVPGGVAFVQAELAGIPPLLLLTAEVTLTPVAADGVAAGDPLPAAVTSTAAAWAVPWAGIGVIALVVGVVWLVRWRRRHSRALLAEELAEYADRVRAEHAAAAAADPAPAGAGFVPRTGGGESG